MPHDKIEDEKRRLAEKLAQLDRDRDRAIEQYTRRILQFTARG